MMTTHTKTTIALSTAPATVAKPMEELDSHRAAAFLLLQVKEMATDELVSRKEEQQQKKKHKKKKTPSSLSTNKTTNAVTTTTTTAPSVSLPCSPLLCAATPRPLPQKPQLPRSTSANFLLPPPQVTTGPSSMTLTAGPGPLAAGAQLWFLPSRRTVSLGSSSENLPGLLLKAMKREQQEREQAEITTATAGSESPTTMMMMSSSMTSSISSLSTLSSYGSSSSSTWSSLLSSDAPLTNTVSPALVSPITDRPASDMLTNHNKTAMLLPTIPLEAAATAAVQLMLDNKDCSDKNNTMMTNDDDTNGATTLPLPPLASATATTTAAGSTTDAVVVLRRKFSWKTHPVLEQYLLDHRCEYLAYSAKLNYTAEQKRYNNTLTTNLIRLAAENGLVFCAEHFSFAAIRDRIRCFYKSHVQAAKKKKRKQQQQQQASSTSNDNNSSPGSPSLSSKRKKIKLIKTTTSAAAAAAAATARDTAMPLTLTGQLEEEDDGDDSEHPVDHLEIMAE